jgi:hypothetical protein
MENRFPHAANCQYATQIVTFSNYHEYEQYVAKYRAILREN